MLFKLSLKLKHINHLKRINQICLKKAYSQHQNFTQINDEILYEGHRPINTFQKGLLAVGSAIAGVTNPYRSDMVAALGESLFPETALRKIQLEMLNSESGRMILKDKPIIDGNSLNVEELLSYPKDSLGYMYANFMNTYQLSSEVRDPVHYISNTELAYIMKRYRQIHDFVHVILGMSVSVPEEVIVKWFEWAHFGLPMNMVSAIFGPFATTSEEKETIKKYIMWALNNGYNSKQIMNIYFEKELETNFESLKKRLNIMDPPKFY